MKPDAFLSIFRIIFMAHYRIYIDEVGNHDLTHADNVNHRYLSLTGVFIESSHSLSVIAPEMDAIKREFFQRDPDEPVIFHRKDMVNKRPPFECLRNPSRETEFNTALLSAMSRWDYRVITVLIDKKAHRDQYAVWRFHPYHYCLTAMLERFVLFLHYSNQKGDVMVEARGSEEDGKLKQSYERLYEQGTDNISKEIWQNCLTSSKLKVKPKSANIAGLQLADLLAHPAQRQMLFVRGLVAQGSGVFGQQVCKILDGVKYHRSKNGKIDGYGQKLLP